MTLSEAKSYIFQAVKEGYMTEEYAERLEKLEPKHIIKVCEELGERGNFEANEMSLGEAIDWNNEILEAEATGN